MGPRRAPPPEDGYIIEQNVALHETIVDNTTNLVQIAKVDPLIVLASGPRTTCRHCNA